MILTGTQITHEVRAGDILIDPFDVGQVNPNSYNFRLSRHMIRTISHRGLLSHERFDIPSEGFLLQPRVLYLGSTAEIIGSKKHAITLLGRSSLGRLGIFLNATADLGHVGTVARWTLEISVVQAVRVYPDMLFGQVAFWHSEGSHWHYHGRYQHDLEPRPNRDATLYGGLGQ